MLDGIFDNRLQDQGRDLEKGCVVDIVIYFQPVTKTGHFDIDISIDMLQLLT